MDELDYFNEIDDDVEDETSEDEKAHFYAADNNVAGLRRIVAETNDESLLSIKVINGWTYYMKL